MAFGRRGEGPRFFGARRPVALCPYLTMCIYYMHMCVYICIYMCIYIYIYT